MEYKKVIPQITEYSQQEDGLLSARSYEEIPVEPKLQYGMNLSAADRKTTNQRPHKQFQSDLNF